MIETQASTGLLASLGIHGWQFFGQCINFSVVLIVMWKWVYTPLLKLMDQRAKEIEEGLSNAKIAEQRLKDAASEKERIMKEARVEAQDVLEEVKTKAEAVRAEKLELAKFEIEKHINEAKAQIKSEREMAMVALKREVADMIVTATERVTTGLDESQQRALLRGAVDHLDT